MVHNPLGILREYLHLKREHWLDREQLESAQLSRFAEIARIARSTPFYVKNVPNPCGGSAGDCRPEDLPLLQKDAVRANPRDFLNPALPHERLHIMRTSGSSGTPLGMYSDQRAHERRHAIGLLISQDFRRSPFDLFAEITRSDAKLSPFPVPGLFRKRHLSIFQDEREIYESLLRMRPDIMGWYPSMAMQLARINDRRGNPLRLKSVFCGGETLSDEARRSIESSFSCTVHEQYASVEFSAMAWECPEEHRMHVDESSFRIEIVDDAGRPKRSGVGNVAVTCFFNRAMPLVRYLIGDCAKWGRECGCGRGTRVLDSITGRSDDFIVLPSGRLRNSFAFNLLYYGENVPGVWKYQIVQEREDLIVFRHVPEGGGLSDAGRAALEKRILMACLGEDVNVEFEEVASIPRDQSGKLRKIISKVAPRARGGHPRM